MNTISSPITYPPKRKLVRRSTVRVVGYHASHKMKCMIPWESQIERDFLQWLEIDPNVTAFYAQPKTFEWWDTRYTPDALVHTRHGSYYAEVKPDRFLESGQEFENFERLQARFQANALHLRLKLESEIRAEPRRANIVRLSRALRTQVQRDHWHQLQAALAGHPLPLEDLETALGNEHTTNIIFKCVCAGLLSLDLNVPITPNILIQLNN